MGMAVNVMLEFQVTPYIFKSLGELDVNRGTSPFNVMRNSIYQEGPRFDMKQAFAWGNTKFSDQFHYMWHQDGDGSGFDPSFLTLNELYGLGERDFYAKCVAIARAHECDPEKCRVVFYFNN